MNNCRTLILSHWQRLRDFPLPNYCAKRPKQKQKARNRRNRIFEFLIDLPWRTKAMDVDESDPAPGPSRQPSQGSHLTLFLSHLLGIFTGSIKVKFFQNFAWHLKCLSVRAGNDESKTLYMAGPGTAGSVTVSLHPLVIMNISEHWTRFVSYKNTSLFLHAP